MRRWIFALVALSPWLAQAQGGLPALKEEVAAETEARRSADATLQAQVTQLASTVASLQRPGSFALIDGAGNTLGAVVSMTLEGQPLGKGGAIGEVHFMRDGAIWRAVLQGWPTGDTTRVEPPVMWPLVYQAADCSGPVFTLPASSSVYHANDWPRAYPSNTVFSTNTWGRWRYYRFVNTAGVALSFCYSPDSSGACAQTTCSSGEPYLEVNVVSFPETLCAWNEQLQQRDCPLLIEPLTIVPSAP